MGNFKKQNFDARGDVVVFGATAVRFRASQPNGLGCSEVTKSAFSLRFMRSFAAPTSKTAMAVFGTVTATCHSERSRECGESKFCGEEKAFTPFGAKPSPACRAQGYETSLMYPAKGEELFIGNRQNGERPYRKASHTLKKCRHFLPSVRVYTTHGSSTRAEIYRIAQP